LRLAFHDATAQQPSANGKLFDEIIQGVTGSPYVHVELVLCHHGDDRNAQTFSAVPGDGVRFTHINLTEPWWKVVELPRAGQEGLKAAQAAALAYRGQKYDWLGILGFGLPPWMDELHDARDKFCSEVCTLVLQEAGFFRGVKSWRVSPGELYRMAEALF
jgi:hypothetical protein